MDPPRSAADLVTLNRSGIVTVIHSIYNYFNYLIPRHFGKKFDPIHFTLLPNQHILDTAQLQSLLFHTMRVNYSLDTDTRII